MTETIEQLIQARFDALATPGDDASWSDVLARAHSAEPRRASVRIALAAAVVVLAATATAVAFGWPGRVVDFFHARPAPQSVKAFFRAHNSVFPRGVNPDTRLGQPRKIMTAIFDPNHLPPRHQTLHTLYVAPRTGGGFCFVWTTLGGSCAGPQDPERARTDPAARPTGFTWLENDSTGFVDGWIRGNAKTLQAHFADQTTVAIPVTWVSAPIDAGFFAYVVPLAHLTRANALTDVVALDADGKVVARQTFPLTKPLDEDVLQTFPDGTKLSLPRRAQAARAREPFSFRTPRGRAYLWVMPRTGGGICFYYGTGAGGGGGCPSRYWLAHIPMLDGDARDGVYFAQVKPEVAALVLHYGNGESEKVRPTDGFVLHDLERGARLTTVVGLDRSGKPIATQNMRSHRKPQQERG